MLALWTKVEVWRSRAATWLTDEKGLSEKGASLVEYALLVVLIAIVALIAIALAGTRVSEAFSTIADSLEQGT